MHLWFIVLCWTDLPYFPRSMSHCSWLILIIKLHIRSPVGGEIITEALWEWGNQLNCLCSISFGNYEMPLSWLLHKINRQQAAFEKSLNCKTGVTAYRKPLFCASCCNVTLNGCYIKGITTIQNMKDLKIRTKSYWLYNPCKWCYSNWLAFIKTVVHLVNTFLFTASFEPAPIITLK